MVEDFSTPKRFFDDKHYPRGFSRHHGDFTIKEAELLERHGCACRELHKEQRGPLTEAEQRFVDVCHGLCEPVTEIEKLWTKYMERTSCPKRFHTLSGGKPQADITEEYTDSED